jgi:competence protein ComEC
MSDNNSRYNFYNACSSCPLLPVVIVYMAGIVSGKCFSAAVYLAIAAGTGLLFSFFIRNLYLKAAIFYAFVFLMGNLFFQFIQEKDTGPRHISAREKIRKIIYYNVPEGEERDLLAGLFLGERRKVSKELVEILQNTNTIHILAISGDHIGFIGLIFVGVLRLILVPRKLSVFIAFIFVLSYVSMLGWQAPTFRAAVMFGVFAFGLILDRPFNVMNTLSFAALVILLLSPQSLFQPGFQLSFIIVLGLLIMPPKNSCNYFNKLLWSSFVAWLCSVPLVAHYFQVFSPISVIANIVMVSGISIVLAIGFMSILAGSIYIVLSGIFNAVNYFIIKSLICFLKFIYNVPLGYFYVSNFEIHLVIILYISIGVLFLSLSRKREIVIQ